MGWKREQIETYIKETRSLVLATVNQNGDPDLRSIGGYGIRDLNIYFATAKDSAKVAQIKEHQTVAALFLQEGQEKPKNITVYGTAKAVEADEAEEGIAVIKQRRPQFAYNEKTQLIYRITVEKIKILDFESETKTQILFRKEI